MHQDIDNARIALLNRAFHLVRDVVTLPDGNVAIYFHVKIDIKAEPHFANEALVDPHYALYRAR